MMKTELEELEDALLRAYEDNHLLYIYLDNETAKPIYAALKRAILRRELTNFSKRFTSE